MSNEKKPMVSKVVVKGYVSSVEAQNGVRETEFYVWESTNCTAMLPGQKVSRTELESAINAGITVVVRRK